MILLHTWVNPELEDKDLHFSFLFNRNFFVYDSTSEIQVKFEGIKNPTKQKKKKPTPKKSSTGARQLLSKAKQLPGKVQAGPIRNNSASLPAANQRRKVPQDCLIYSHSTLNARRSVI